jgi:fructoselysine-6-P-deglycase FrlB-like protein
VIERGVPILAVGDIGLEHFIVPGADGTERWGGARLDGTGARTIARLGKARTTSLLGSRAEDEDASALATDLNGRGVALHLRPHDEPTRQGFVVRSTPSAPLFPPSPRRLTRRCWVCGQRQPPSRAARLEAESWIEERQPTGPSVLLFDRLSEFRRRLATNARRHGGSSVLALDDPLPLRFLPAVGLLAAISDFDLVVLGWRVARTLVRRLGLRDVDDLSSYSRSPNLISLQPSGAVSIAAGRRVRLRLPPPALERPPDDLFEATLTCLSSEWTPALASDRRTELLEHAVLRAHRTEVEDLLIELPRLRRGTDLGQLRAYYDSQPSGRCPLCRLPHANVPSERTASPRRKPGARTNVGWLIRRAFAATERPLALRAVEELLGTSGSAYCVGSGGSFPVAAFAAQTLTSCGRLFAQPIRPMDYVRTAGPTDAVVMISYSGANADTAAVLTRARELGVGRVALLTASVRPPLANLLRRGDLLLSHGNPRGDGAPEPGFVSIAATVAPCALITAAVAGPGELAELRRELPDTIVGDVAIGDRLALAMREELSLALIGGGWAWPTMLDIESKWTEADLGGVAIHEVKDFSHGRFLSVLGPQAVQAPLILSTGEQTEYERLLISVLDNLSPVELRTQRDGPVGAFEMILRAQFVTERAAGALGRDLSRPELIPEDGLRLYRWNGEKATASHPAHSV